MYVGEGEPLTKKIYIKKWRLKMSSPVAPKTTMDKLHIAKKCCYKTANTFEFVLFH